MNRPSFRVRTALLALFMIGGHNHVYSCDVLVPVVVPMRLSNCPDITITGNLMVEGDLCINGSATIVDDNVTILGAETLCVPALTAATLITTTTATPTTAMETSYHNLVANLAVMCSNSEISSRPTVRSQVNSTHAQLTGRTTAGAISTDGSIAAYTMYDEVFSSNIIYIDILRRIYAPAGSTWDLAQTLTVTGDTPLSLALSADGSVLALGAELLTGGISDGNVIIYRYNPAVEQWLAEQLITSSDTSTTFGYSLSISADGRLIAVGSIAKVFPGTLGYITIFQSQPSCTTAHSWTTQAVIEAPDTSTAFGFSNSLSPEGLYLLVGAPNPNILTNVAAAHFYRNTPTGWQFAQSITSTEIQGAVGITVALAEEARYATLAAIFFSGTSFTHTLLACYANSHRGLLTNQANFENTFNNVFSFGGGDRTFTGISADGTTAMSFFLTGLNGGGFRTLPISLFKRFDDTWQIDSTLTITALNNRNSVALSRDGACLIATALTTSLGSLTSSLFAPAADTIHTDLIMTESLCIEQQVTVTGSLYVTGNITHGGTLSASTSDDAPANRIPPTLCTQITRINQRQTKLIAQSTKDRL